MTGGTQCSAHGATKINMRIRRALEFWVLPSLSPMDVDMDVDVDVDVDADGWTWSPPLLLLLHLPLMTVRMPLRRQLLHLRYGATVTNR